MGTLWCALRGIHVPHHTRKYNLSFSSNFYRAKHQTEVKRAKSEAKQGSHLLSHSLAKEFKAASSPEEKRELLNSTLNKLRQIGEEQVSKFVSLLIV